MNKRLCKYQLSKFAYPSTDTLRVMSVLDIIPSDTGAVIICMVSDDDQYNREVEVKSHTPLELLPDQSWQYLCYFEQTLWLWRFKDDRAAQLKASVAAAVDIWTHFGVTVAEATKNISDALRVPTEWPTLDSTGGGNAPAAQTMRVVPITVAPNEDPIQFMLRTMERVAAEVGVQLEFTWAIPTGESKGTDQDAAALPGG